MNRLRITTVFCIIFLSSAVLIPFANADWTMFHADTSHSGIGTGNPVLTPTLLWKYNTGDAVYSSPAVVNGIVYVGSENGNFYALNAANGNQIWNYSTGATPGIWSSAAVSGGVVYVGGGSIVYAFDANSGAVLWTYGGVFNGNQPISSSPTVANGIVYIGSSDTPQGGYFYALSASNGTPLWDYNVQGAFASSPAIVNGVVYIGAYPSLYAFNATTGSVLWDYASTAPGASAPAVVNGVVYEGSSWTDNVLAFDASSGVQIWNYSTGMEVDSSPAVVNGVVYIGAGIPALPYSGAMSEGNVYALNAATGSEIWIFTPPVKASYGNAVTSSPAVADGVVYVGSYDWNVLALNSSSGAQLWNYTLGGDIESSPAVVNGVVYIGSDDGYVYALGGSPTSSPTPSPTLSQNPTASPSPTIPEFPSAIIGVAVLMALTTVALSETKKMKRRLESTRC